jgi:hypothetical protein
VNWINIKTSSQLPRNGRVFLSLWKGRICLTQYDEDESRFYIMFDPADYSQSWQITPERENKFTHYMELPELPIDY